MSVGLDPRANVHRGSTPRDTEGEALDHRDIGWGGAGRNLLLPPTLIVRSHATVCGLCGYFLGPEWKPPSPPRGHSVISTTRVS